MQRCPKHRREVSRLSGQANAAALTNVCERNIFLKFRSDTPGGYAHLIAHVCSLGLNWITLLDFLRLPFIG